MSGEEMKFLEEFVSIMELPRPAFEYVTTATSTSIGTGIGDCSEHGRWYGICYGCQSDSKKAYDNWDHEYEWTKEKMLKDLKYRISSYLQINKVETQVESHNIG